MVLNLHSRNQWASIPKGMPKKDVFVHGQELLMAIFVDSFYK